MSYKSKYFSINEISCRDGCGRKPNDKMLEVGDKLREGWAILHPDKPGLDCISGARCDAYTEVLRKRKIPAAKKSAHIDCEAMDLSPVNKMYKEFHAYVLGRAEELDVCIEDFSATPLWCHVQVRKLIGAKKRTFLP